MRLVYGWGLLLAILATGVVFWGLVTYAAIRSGLIGAL
jgi:hypothetical protein